MFFLYNTKRRYFEESKCCSFPYNEIIQWLGAVKFGIHYLLKLSFCANLKISLTHLHIFKLKVFCCHRWQPSITYLNEPSLNMCKLNEFWGEMWEYLKWITAEIASHKLLFDFRELYGLLLLYDNFMSPCTVAVQENLPIQ